MHFLKINFLMTQKRQARGFTLLEVLAVIAILAIFAAMVAPSFRATILTSRLKTTGVSILSAVTLAKNEAVTRGRAVRVCPIEPSKLAAPTCIVSASNQQWLNPLMVFLAGSVPGDDETSAVSDERILRIYPESPGMKDIVVTSSGPGEVGRLIFSTQEPLPLGSLQGGVEFSARFCLPGNTQGQLLRISSSGAAALEKITSCP